MYNTSLKSKTNKPVLFHAKKEYLRFLADIKNKVTTSRLQAALSVNGVL